MKNILIIVPSLKFGGGAERVATTIGSELFKSGYKISYFTFYNVSNKYSFLGNEYCLNEKLYNNIFMKIIKLFSRAIKIAKYSKKNKITCIISHMEDANFSVILSKILGNKAKINVVIHHSISDYGKGVYYRLIKLLYKYSNNIIVLTEFEEKNLIDNIGIKDKRISVINNSVDINQINILKNEDLGEYKKIFQNNNFTFITTGRLTWIKNQELMINAFLRLNDKYKNSQLIIIGEGEEKQKLMRIANKNVYFLGYQKNVFKFLNFSKCFLLTSFSEAFPISLLEAIACSLPVISTNTQGANEILGNGKYGILTKNHNEFELYYAMEKIITDTNYRKHFVSESLKRSQEYELGNIIAKREKIL